jgi:hypothetical protein
MKIRTLLMCIHSFHQYFQHPYVCSFVAYFTRRESDLLMLMAVKEPLFLAPVHVALATQTI